MLFSSIATVLTIETFIEKTYNIARNIYNWYYPQKNICDGDVQVYEIDDVDDADQVIVSKKINHKNHKNYKYNKNHKKYRVKHQKYI